jgi:uncharacterized protein YbjT (DUF2867 family)
VIAVTGGTGKTGHYVIRSLIDVGLPVRVLVHSERSADRLPPGVAEHMVGDMLVPADARRVISGADAVVHIGPALHPREIAMGETVIDTAAEAGVAHFLLMSVTHPQLEPLLNHQSKLAAERRLLMSRLPFTILQPMHYMQDVEVSSVVAEGVYRQPYSLDVPLSFVDLADVGEVAAMVLSDPAPHVLATYELCGTDTLTGREVAAEISKVAGREITAEFVDPDQILAGMAHAPGYTRDALRRLFAHYDSYGLTGNANVLRWLLGREPTTFRDYVSRDVA